MNPEKQFQSPSPTEVGPDPMNNLRFDGATRQALQERRASEALAEQWAPQVGSVALSGEVQLESATDNQQPIIDHVPGVTPLAAEAESTVEPDYDRQPITVDPTQLSPVEADKIIRRSNMQAEVGPAWAQHMEEAREASQANR